MTWKIDKPLEKWAKDLNRHVTKEDVANKHMKSYAISLSLGKYKLKTHQQAKIKTRMLTKI